MAAHVFFSIQENRMIWTYFTDILLHHYNLYHENAWAFTHLTCWTFPVGKTNIGKILPKQNRPDCWQFVRCVHLHLTQMYCTLSGLTLQTIASMKSKMWHSDWLNKSSKWDSVLHTGDPSFCWLFPSLFTPKFVMWHYVMSYCDITWCHAVILMSHVVTSYICHRPCHSNGTRHLSILLKYYVLKFYLVTLTFDLWQWPTIPA